MKYIYINLKITIKFSNKTNNLVQKEKKIQFFMMIIRILWRNHI